MTNHLTPQISIEDKIYIIRGYKVMIDRDLAELYGVKTKALNQAVRRNLNRFPDDFVIQLTEPEKEQLVTICDRFSPLKHSSYLPYGFTEQGVAMLSSVLDSERAVLVNIQIMRIFAKLREMISSHKDLQRKINEMERNYDERFKVVFEALKKLLGSPEQFPKVKGFIS